MIFEKGKEIPAICPICGEFEVKEKQKILIFNFEFYTCKNPNCELNKRIS